MIARCGWAGSDPDAAYHDRSGACRSRRSTLFEFLILEGAQAGLSWVTILRKRENYRRAFDGFDARKVARYRRAKVARAAGRPRHRPQPPQDRRRDRERAGLPRGQRGVRRASTRTSGGSSAAAAARIAWHGMEEVPATHARIRRHEQATSSGAASASSARRSATPSCRRPAWSTTTPNPVSARRRPIKAHLLRWRPRPHAQRRETTPRVRPSGAASQLDLSRPPAWPWHIADQDRCRALY